MLKKSLFRTGIRYVLGFGLFITLGVSTALETRSAIEYVLGIGLVLAMIGLPSAVLGGLLVFLLGKPNFGKEPAASSNFIARKAREPSLLVNFDTGLPMVGHVVDSGGNFLNQ